MSWSPLKAWQNWRNQSGNVTNQDVADESAADEAEAASEKKKPSEKVRISIIKLHGDIQSGTEESLNFENMKEPIEKAFKKRGIKAVVLDINCPGGSPVEADLIARKIFRESARKGIPVLAFVHEVAASGGYWIACAADEIYAMPASITGSIGVISEGMGYDKLIAQLGIERRIHTSGTRKSQNDPFLPQNEDDIAKKEEIQSGIHDLFIAWVKERREGLLTADDDTIMNGDYWLSDKALEYGLIDGIKDMEGLLEDYYGDNVDCEEFGPKQQSLLSKIFFSSAANISQASVAQTIASGVIDAATKKARSEATWSRFRVK